MQYTGLSFSENLAEHLLPAGLKPKVTVPIPTEIFPRAERLSAQHDDPFLASGYEPVLRRIADTFSRLRWLQHGVMQTYLVYILVAVIAALAWATFGIGGGRP
jgi:hypothetical protein